MLPPIPSSHNSWEGLALWTCGGRPSYFSVYPTRRSTLLKVLRVAYPSPFLPQGASIYVSTEHSSRAPL